MIVFGGTGFIGKILQSALTAKGHTVMVSDTRRNPQWEKDLATADAVVNLAGSPLFGKRWNDAIKAEIHDSRTEGTKKIVDAIGRAKKTGGRPITLVNASAIGYYGPGTPGQNVTESSAPGADFLAFVCREWEEEALRAEHAHGVRTAIVRIGVVLGKGEGALQKMLPFFRLGLGGPIEFGLQDFSWVHVDDVVGIILHALETDSVRGIFNASSPNPVSNKVFTKALGHVLHRPTLFPVPGLALWALYGECAEVLVNGQRVIPENTLKSGYKFKFPELEAALKDVV